jgi:uncharacterized membrane protein
MDGLDRGDAALRCLRCEIRPISPLVQRRSRWRSPISRWRWCGLTVGRVSDPEQYTFSAVWLGYGVVLLLVGLLLDSKPARLASGAVITLTIAKVFLVDLSGLTGIWRALSFIGLGLVLVGIGYLYQRLLFPPRAALSPPEARDAGP